MGRAGYPTIGDTLASAGSTASRTGLTAAGDVWPFAVTQAPEGAAINTAGPLRTAVAAAQ
jgi:hypothetical protein